SLRELSHVAASRDPNNTQRVLSLSSKKERRSGRLPRLADGACHVPLLARVGDVLEVRAFGLGDPENPCAIGPVEETRAPLGAEGLGGLDRGRAGRSVVGGGERLAAGRHDRRRGDRKSVV